MLTCQAQRFLFHIKRLGFLNLILPFLDITDTAVLLQLGEGVLDSLDVILFQLPLDDRVIIPIDEGILWRLILDDTHLGVHIVLHLEIIAVQMVRRDIEQNGNIGTEIIHIIELERGQLNDVIFMRILSNLQGQ